MPCAPGTYNPASNQSACWPCDAGYYCPDTNMTTPVICPIGSYCPSNSSQPQKCPAGTYGIGQGLGNVSACTPCDPGHYCDTNGLTAPVGECDAGFYCSSGSPIRAPTAFYAANGNICPPGSYCPVGSPGPLPCPAGTYSASYQLSSDAQVC